MNDQLTIPRPTTTRLNNTRRYAIYGTLFGLGFPALALGISLALNRLPLSAAAILALHVNEPLLWIIDTAPFVLGAIAAMAGSRQDAVEDLNANLRRQGGDLAIAQRSLELRVEQRTADLEQRNIQLRRAAQITRKLARISGTEELMQAGVQAIAEGFGDFVVDLYMIDDRRSEAVLTASSEATALSERPGPRSHQVGAATLIGQVAGSGEVGRSMTGVRGPELALPLLARGLPSGVLHVRASQENVTLPADTELLQLVTDQLAASLEAAHAMRETTQALDDLREVSGQSVQRGWRQGLPGSSVAFEYTPTGTRPLRSPVVEFDARSLRIPLELRGQPIGTIALKRNAAGEWTESDRDLAQKTAAQVALALENVRLLEETRERAQTERLLSDFSARLNQSVSLDTLLQTAVRELAALPEVADASIYLNPEAAPAAAAGAQLGTGE